MDPAEGQMTGAPTPEPISTQLHRIATQRVQDGGLSVPQRTHALRSRMRESRTSGSVGAPGW